MAVVIDANPETAINCLPTFGKSTIRANKNQKTAREIHNRNIAVKATGLAGLDMPFIAVSFKRLHQ